MLDFYLGTGGIDNLGKHLGSLSSDGIYWLQKYEFLKMGKTGHLPEDDPESLPYFDDVILSFDQVQKIYRRFEKRVILARQVPGFMNPVVNTLEKILLEAIENDSGITTLAD